MAISVADTQLFAMLFAGNKESYGLTRVKGTDEKTGKVEVDCRLVHLEVTDALYMHHLAGDPSIGIAPIDIDGYCHFGAIDIDSECDEHAIVNAIYRNHFPIFPFHSKSGKLHLFVFFDEGVEPIEVIDLLKQYLLLFGLNPKTEIFPKQASKRASNTYSWINLPYFNAESDNIRKLIDADFTHVPLTPALLRMQDKRMSLAKHKKVLQEYEWYEAPPCVTSGLTMLNVTPGHRNDWLFSVGVFLRMKYGDGPEVEDKIRSINASLSTPLASDELENTVIASMRKETYFYRCASMSYCDKAICRKSEYGISSNKSTGLEYGQITQVLTDPPYYTWVVSGQLLVFHNEFELINQMQFRQLCVRNLHILPKKVNDEIWSSIVTKALKNIIVEYEDVEGDFTSGSTFMAIIHEYFNHRRHARTMSEIAIGRVYREDDVYYFSAQSLLAYVRENRDFKSYDPVELRIRIGQMGGKKGLNNLWTIPVSAVDEPDKPNLDEIDVSDPDSPINNKDF